MRLTTKELKEFVGDIIDTNKTLQKQGKKPVSIEIQGEAGLGKTSALLQLCEEKDMEMVKINLAQIEEIGDLVGFPVKEFQICRTVDDTEECIWTDEIAYQSYLTAGFKPTGISRMAYAPPEWIQGRKHPNGGVLLLDDWTRADMRFIQACMELIDRQQYISWSLPQGWTICLTSNPSDSADYVVTDIDEAQKTRFMSIDLKFDKDCWAEWAEGKIDGRCINFVLLNEDVVKKEVNPRVLEMFFNTVSTIKDFDIDLPKIQMLGEASVGDEVGTMFTLFINNKLDKLVPPEKIFTADSKWLLGEIKSTVKSGNDFRADIASVLAVRFANYIGKYSHKNKIDKDHLDKIEELVKSESLGEDNNYNMVKTIFNSNKQKFTAMIKREAFMKHISK